MTQIYITIAIIGIIALLVCYVFIRQTLGEKQKEKDRLHRALVKRAKELLQVLSIFPEDFLPKELVVFIYRCIIDAYEQLSRLMPEDNTYVEALKMHSSQLEATIRKPDNAKFTELQSSAQINELRQHLNLLGNFLQKSLKRKHITPKQHAHYRQLLKELIIKLAVNNYTITAKQALDMQKTKLSIHYYDLAKKLLIRETPSHYQESIDDINRQIEPLIELEKTEQAELNSTQNDNDDGEWGEVKDESDWKKKNVYD